MTQTAAAFVHYLQSALLAAAVDESKAYYGRRTAATGPQLPSHDDTKHKKCVKRDLQETTQLRKHYSSKCPNNGQ